MHIKMKEDRRGCHDGFTVRQYHTGCIYEVPEAMGTSFVRKEWATEVTGKVVPPSPPSDIGASLVRANIDFDKLFRPQPTRGSAPANVSTLLAKGIDV